MSDKATDETTTTAEKSTVVYVLCGNRKMQNFMRAADMFEAFKYLVDSLNSVTGLAVDQPKYGPDETVDRTWAAVEADTKEYPVVCWDARAPDRVRIIPGMKALSNGHNWCPLWQWLEAMQLKQRPDSE